MNTKIIALYFLDQILSIFGMGVALFWSAGRIDWWPAMAAMQNIPARCVIAYYQAFGNQMSGSLGKTN